MTQYEDDESQARLGASVLPEEIEELAVPAPLDQLSPWHSPRKQYIRKNQWAAHTCELIDRLKGKGLIEDRFRYLSLPGRDLFDVEVIGEMAKSRGIKVEVLGFFSEAAKEPERARSNVRLESLIKQGLIEDTSKVVPSLIQDIVRPHSQANKEFNDLAPFHVINIDACGSIAQPSGNSPNRIIDALHRLVELQLDRMRDPWLLFVTTSVRPEGLSEEVRKKLEEAIITNASHSDAFKKEAIGCLGDTGADCLDSAIQQARQPSKYLSLFCLGFSKWLIHNACTARWDVKCLKFYRYTTAYHDGQSSMPCLAYEFRPRKVTMPDPLGIVQPPRSHPDEPPDYSLRAISSTNGLKDLDSLLRDNPLEMAKYAASQRELLVGAGYQSAALQEFDSVIPRQ